MRPDDRSADERRLVAGALAALGALAVPVIAAAGLVAGWPGAGGATVGLALVAILFGGSAVLLRRVTRRRPGQVVAIMAGGAVARLAFYALSLGALARLDVVHRPSLAAAAAVAVAVTLAYELRLLSRMPRLFWVDASVARPADLPTPTRSPSL